MKTQDLRIGNFVSLSYMKGQFFKVKELSEYHVYFSHVTENYLSHTVYQYCEPIPLTEEWLKKFGFDVKHNGYQLNGILIKYNLKGGFVVDISQCIGFVGLNYVHELQNLYHSLTREELTLKENT